MTTWNNVELTYDTKTNAAQRKGRKNDGNNGILKCRKKMS
jgi:hypothetical protein